MKGHAFGAYLYLTICIISVIPSDTSRKHGKMTRKDHITGLENPFCSSCRLNSGSTDGPKKTSISCAIPPRG